MKYTPRQALQLLHVLKKFSPLYYTFSSSKFQEARLKIKKP